MEDYTWVGLFVPAATPRPVAQKLNDAVRKAVADPELKKRLDSLAFEITAQPLRETAAYVKAEVGKWAKVVRETGAKVD
jgi:tripartite-type tricarboxylate transporter receptor subunit TctC